MMVAIEITDRGSGVSLRPMGSSNYSFTFTSSTEISQGVITGEKRLAENIQSFLCCCRSFMRIIFGLCEIGCTMGKRPLFPVILKLVANPFTRVLCFRLPFIGQFLSENSRSIICMSPYYHHSFE